MTTEQFNEVSSKLIRYILDHAESIGLDEDGPHLIRAAKRLDIPLHLLREFVQLTIKWPAGSATLMRDAFELESDAADQRAVLLSGRPVEKGASYETMSFPDR